MCPQRPSVSNETQMYLKGYTRQKLWADFSARSGLGDNRTKNGTHPQNCGRIREGPIVCARRNNSPTPRTPWPGGWKAQDDALRCDSRRAAPWSAPGCTATSQTEMRCNKSSRARAWTARTGARVQYPRNT